jgi:DNA-binding MarR family transcriptional regulator
MQVTQFELSNLIRKAKLFSKIKLTPASRLVIESLVFHYPNIRVNVKTIQDETGNSRSSVLNAIKELKENGLILTVQTGRSSIFKLTQKFFDLLEIAPQTSKKDNSRGLDIRLPNNKQEKKEIKKEVLKFSNKKEPDWLKYRDNAEVILSGYHSFNIKEKDVEIIKAIVNKWKITDSYKFPILKYIKQAC